MFDGVDLGGLRAVVTGASSGLGVETARALAASGAEVVLAVRDPAAGEAVAQGITTSTDSTRPRVVALDLADRRSVARLAAAWRGALHLLVSNAGVVTSGLERKREGWELQFATNHLGHLALALGLHRALALGASERGGARVVSVSSTAHMRRHRLRRPPLPATPVRPPDRLRAVQDRQLAVRRGSSRRWAEDGAVANTVDPGGVRTGLERHFSAGQQRSSTRPRPPAPSARVVRGPLPRRLPGGLRRPDDAALAEHPHGVKRWARDAGAADRLWTTSTALLGH